MKDSNSMYKKPSDTELRTRLTREQYYCTQEEGTEQPFNNPFWNNHADGIYVDVVSGEPLFSSLDKFDSGTGWPSFTQPIDKAAVIQQPDHKFGVERTELRSKNADSHLGHVFDDGPEPTGQRFCINSASLRFIPLSELKSQGYGKYLFQFAEKMNWQLATLAGGCFWGVENLLKEIPGVIETQVGYAGGTSKNVGYEDVVTGQTGHAESIQILFDPKRLSYEEILLKFFKMHDPTTLNRQENDVGTQYRSAIFYHTADQKKMAEAIKRRVEQSEQWSKPIVTEITSLSVFVRAEEYHQKYLVKNPDGYNCHYVRKLKF